jgi:6,7-dimethyl-8-ribityllumazine synthase
MATSGAYTPAVFQLPHTNFRVAVIHTSWNSRIVDVLKVGALDLLRKYFPNSQISVFQVPGAYELPLAAAEALKSGFDGVVCLGCVIKGETPHFHYVSEAACTGIREAGMQQGKPCMFGVLTVDTEQQALDRAGGRHGNKGTEAAQGLLEMFAVLADIRNSRN